VPGGGFLVADTGNNRVRQVLPDGHISTVAGNGTSIGPNVHDEGGPATSAPLDAPRSTAISPDGSVLIGTSDSIRLLVRGRGAVNLLAVAIQPLLATVTHNGLRLHLAVTKPARVTARLYRSATSKPSLTTRAARISGEAMLALRSGILPPRVYALDVTVATRSQTARASEWLYLGARLTQHFILSLQQAEAFGTTADRTTARIADPMEGPLDCHQFGPTRVDCDWGLDSCDFIAADFLTNQGLVYSRTYGCPTRPRAPIFNRSPSWTSGRTWEDLSLVWH
jgi:hypothetical protein